MQQHQQSGIEQQKQPQQHHTCLVAGDSYAARLDASLLGRNNLPVQSVAKGGATIGFCGVEW